MKPKFNPASYAGIVAMVFDNIDEAIIFVEYFGSMGYCWHSGDSFTDIELIKRYYAMAARSGRKFFIDFNRGFWGCVGDRIFKENSLVLNFSDFNWGKDDIKIDVDRCLSLI